MLYFLPNPILSRPPPCTHIYACTSVYATVTEFEAKPVAVKESRDCNQRLWQQRTGLTGWMLKDVSLVGHSGMAFDVGIGSSFSRIGNG